jgi:peptidoglycan L-alanyl-D-glutamate endopeptidase CwlK
MNPDSRSLDDLHPHVKMLCEKHLVLCRDAGIPCTVTFTFRSIATQNGLYAQGRTKPGKRVTNAKGGESFHNYGLAYDLVPTELLKKANWGDNARDQETTNKIWKEVATLGKSIGLEWGGDWKSIKDRPHFQWTNGLTIHDLQAGKRP